MATVPVVTLVGLRKGARVSHTGVVVAAVMLLAGCRAACGEPRALVEARARWNAERRALDERLDALEERLLADQARVRFWGEMRERHGNVAAVACSSLAHHAESVAAYEEQQRAKMSELTRRSRVAARFVPAADAIR
ncbi:hypothetical protein AMYX_24520 [Anaeromyxobacter diazotrophicus]|uniref:Uncharacterized protein n=1 Tax=Anaeromyxobacter diazotrophicus TaxID=2590199 RepID=A0A7I9VMU7_9BACT|nr:hypothetical protein AMYX_24520 [Anaeromyxobacter diazotrophicus]